MKEKITRKYRNIVGDIKENPEILFIISAYIISFINLVITYIIDFKKVDSHDIFTHYSDLTTAIIGNIFNKIFIILLTGLLILYLLIIIIKYFKSKKKKMGMNILLIFSLIFIIIDSIITLGFVYPSNSIFSSIAKMLVFNLTGETCALLFLAYLAIPIISISVFIGIFYSSKKIGKGFLFCILNNTLGILLLIAFRFLIVLLIIMIIKSVLESIIGFIWYSVNRTKN